MYDMHYDLLTILYYNFIEKNKKSNKNKMLEDCKNIYKNNNIRGGLINLYFMSSKEMWEELGIEEAELKDVIEMFKKSIEYLNLLKETDIIPQNIDFLYSIEGCDYLTSEEDLEQLYQLGLRSILPVWNKKNKFGSGNRTESGLTELGNSLIRKAIDLGIIIDISHANERTFDDILDIIEEEKKKGKEVNVIASHSNIRSLCDRKRNLSDRQLIRLKNIGGYLGLFTNGNFLSLDNKDISYDQRQDNFIKHLDYALYKIGFPEDRIMISSDDMNFNPDSSYHHLEAFPLEQIHQSLFSKLQIKYSEELIAKIMIKNAQELILKVHQKEKKKSK